MQPSHPGDQLAAPAATFPRPAVAWASLGVIMLVGLVSNTDRTLIGLLLEPVKQDMGLTDIQLSLAQGPAFGIVYALAAIPIGRFVDRLHRLRLLFLGAAIWGLASIGTAFVTNFEALFAMRMLVGLGSAVVSPAGISLIADYFPPHRRTLANGVFFAGLALGAAFALFAGGPAYELFHAGASLPFVDLAPWREVHLLFGIPGLLMALVIFTIREPRRQERMALANNLRTALKELAQFRGFLVPLFVGLTLVTVCDQAAIVWAAPALTRLYGLSPGEFSALLGAIILISGSACSPLGGLVAEWGRRTRVPGGVLLGAIAAGVIMVPCSCYALFPQMPVFATLFGALVAAAVIANMIAVAGISLYVPNELRGVAIGIYSVMAGVVGVGLAPVLVAFTTTALGGDMKLGQAIALVAAPAAMLSAVSFLIAMKNVRDLGAAAGTVR